MTGVPGASGVVSVRSRWQWAGVGAGVVAMLSLGTLDLVHNYHEAPVVALALSVVRAVPLLFVWWHAMGAWWLGYGAAVVTAVVVTPVPRGEPWPWVYGSLGLLAVMTGIVAAQGNRRATAVVIGAVVVPGVLLVLFTGSPDRGAGVLYSALLCGVGALVGDLLHARSRVSTELAEERQVSAAERDRRAVVEERARIARELHDVVAHHMSMITVQAETARYRLDGLPAPVVDEFAGIARLARGSLTELRGLLGALRDDRDAPARAPQPTLADLDSLVGRIRAAGTPVELRMSGELDGLPSVVRLAAYRVVQEALSNVVRHAGGARTTVSVASRRVAPGSGSGPVGSVLEVEVVNVPPARPGVAGEGGHGLVGLRERVSLLGGRFEVDQPGGGWRVRAWLPAGEVS